MNPSSIIGLSTVFLRLSAAAGHRCGASVDALAASAGMSRRNFIRRFKNATGRVPGAYIQMLRLCARVGYEDMALFRDLFKRHTGMTPAEYRNRFARMSFQRGELSS